MYNTWISFIVNALFSFTILIYMNSVIVQKIRRSRKMFDDNEPKDGQGELKGQGEISTASTVRRTEQNEEY